MTESVPISQWILGLVLILSSLGIILAKKPVHACLSFLMTLLTLAALYLQLSAQFIAVMQVLVYAGAILVIFMFVIVLFQDAHHQIEKFKAKSSMFLLTFAGAAFLISLIALATQFVGFSSPKTPITDDFGTAQMLGHVLYIDFFFPFEAVILIFLVAVVGSLYIGKKVQ